MERAGFFRVVIKDLIDFTVVATMTIAATFAIYGLLPSFARVELSIYFFEQAIELFFINPKLCIWLVGLGFGISVIYFLFCAMLHQTTLGGLVMHLTIVDKKTLAPLSVVQAALMGIGALVGFMIFLVGPLSAWWLDPDTRGFSEKWAGTMLMKKGATIQKTALAS